MSKNALNQIEEALQQAKQTGLEILGIPLFHWKGSDPMTLCGVDAFGALLMHQGKAQPGFPKGWLKELCDSLEVGTFWFWRFNQGWIHQKPITLIVEKDGKETTTVDEISAAAAKLSKKYRV